MNNKRGKILFVSGSLIRGGAQHVLTMLANEYAAKGWDVHIAILLVDGIGYELDPSITVHNFVHGGSRIKNMPKWKRELSSLMRRNHYDVIVSFAARVNMITQMAAKKVNTPVIVSERNDPQHDNRNKLERWLTKHFYKKADKVVFQTEYQKDYYGKACEQNGVVIKNPISAPIYEGEHPSNDIMCVGKLSPQKNHPLMIRAFSAIADDLPDTNVHIYGEGKDREDLQALIDRFHLHDRIFLHGNISTVFDEMRKHKYFVMTSNYEGMSNAMLEAMTSGMAVISTSWNGIDEIVENKKDAYIVPVDDEAALALAMLAVTQNDALRKQLASGAIETAKAYQPDVVMEQWMNTIEEVIY